jgi:hypothetical protein
MILEVAAGVFLGGLGLAVVAFAIWCVVIWLDKT